MHEPAETPGRVQPVNLRPSSSWSTDEPTARGMIGGTDAADGGAHELLL